MLHVPFAAGLASADPDPGRLGGKGASLVAMAALGLPVPPGFVVPVETANSDALERALADGLLWLEERTGRELGGERPLLVSARSGAPVSMPGMMDTVLNVGATARATEALAAEAGEAFARDCRRRFLQGYAVSVSGRSRHDFEDDRPETAERLAASLVPDDAREGLRRAAAAVVASWRGERAERFREIAGLEGRDMERGTALVVQAMVFGNRDARSGTGVMRTRDTATGAPGPTGEWLPSEQGEAVVGGARNPFALRGGENALTDRLPEAMNGLAQAGRALERHARDAQEIEFTVESGHLWLLQARAMRRDDAAHRRIAVDMVREGLIDRAEAVARTRPREAAARQVAALVPGQRLDTIARGLPASPGVASGRVVMDAAAAVRSEGPVVLVREETDPSDVAGINAAAAILTARGGAMSHAASVALALAKPCVTAARGLEVDANGFTVAGRRVRAGETITVDGTAGRAYAGAARTQAPEPDESLAVLLEWAEG